MTCMKVHMHSADLGDINELDDDVCSLLRCRLAEHHALDPLRESVEERDAPFQTRVVRQSPVHGVQLEVVELWEGGVF